MIEATVAAAMQLRVLVRSQGVVGMPGIRIVPGAERGPDAFELVIEDRREPGDEVYESRGIRFYLTQATAERLGRVTLDLSEQDFVMRKPPAR